MFAVAEAAGAIDDRSPSITLVATLMPKIAVALRRGEAGVVIGVSPRFGFGTGSLSWLHTPNRLTRTGTILCASSDVNWAHAVVRRRGSILASESGSRNWTVWSIAHCAGVARLRRFESDHVLAREFADYLDSRGNRHPLPPGAIVTSRGESGRGTTKRSHYALFCRSLDSLVVAEGGSVDFGRLRNLESKRVVGFSQVTAIVVRDDKMCDDGGLRYAVAFRASLVEPYCAKLVDPVAFGNRDMAQMLIAARTHDANATRDLADSLIRRGRLMPNADDGVRPAV